MRLKLILAVVLNLWVYMPYRFLQHHHYFQPITMPGSFCDRLLPFSDKWVWIYLSIYVLMPIGPFLMCDRRQIIRYATGIVLIGAVADFVFIFWPTCCPRPSADGTGTAYQALISIDNPFHAFPSLHAAFAVFSALCTVGVLRELGSRSLFRKGIWVWALLILFATLLTKQHMVADIAAGTVLAFGVHLSVFRQRGFRSETKTQVQAVATNTTHSNSTTP